LYLTIFVDSDVDSDYIFDEEAESFDQLVEQLDRKMYSRPDIELLVNNGILKDEPGRIAASLQATQTNLSKALQAKNLEHKLEQRPSLLQLHEQHIVYSNIDSAVAALKRNQIANTIEETLKHKTNERETML
jgi:hypothetical protein